VAWRRNCMGLAFGIRTNRSYYNFFVIIIVGFGFGTFGFGDDCGFGKRVEPFFQCYGEESTFVDVRVQLGHCVGGVSRCSEDHMS